MLIHGNKILPTIAAYTKIEHVLQTKGLISENRHQGVVEATILGDDWRRFGDDSFQPFPARSFLPRQIRRAGPGARGLTVND